MFFFELRDAKDEKLSISRFGKLMSVRVKFPLHDVSLLRDDQDLSTIRLRACQVIIGRRQTNLPSHVF